MLFSYDFFFKNVKIDEHILYTAFQRFGNVTAVTIKSKYLNKVIVWILIHKCYIIYNIIWLALS